MRTLRALVPVVLALALAGCRSSVPTGVVQWALVKVEIDTQHLGNTGTLPIFRTPDEASGGLVPMASGSLQITDAGKVACEIKVREPVLSYTGEASEHEYILVSFFGVRSESGDRFVLTDAAGTVALGTATELHVDDLGQGQYRVQAATGPRLLPYVYFFDATPAWRAPVRMPHLP